MQRKKLRKSPALLSIKLHLYVCLYLYRCTTTPHKHSHCIAATFIVDGSEWASLVELHGCRGAHGEARGDGQTRGGQPCGHVAGREELVGLQLGDGGPLGRVGVQHPLNERGRYRVDVLQGHTHHKFRVMKRADRRVRVLEILGAGSPRGWCSCSS